MPNYKVTPLPGDNFKSEKVFQRKAKTKIILENSLQEGHPIAEL